MSMQVKQNAGNIWLVECIVVGTSGDLFLGIVG